MPVIP